MKQRKSSLDTVAPVDNQNADDSEGQEPMARPAAPHKPAARLGREVQARIGQQLRAMYNEVVNQGVPPHIAELVRRLSDQDQD